METTAIFSISVVGDESGTPFSGDFTVKTLLSRKEHLQADRIRRELIGPNPTDASARSVSDSIMFSQLAVRIVKAPKWWTDADNGTELADTNVVEEVFTLAIKKENERKEEVKNAAEEAAKRLKKGKAED